MMKIGVWWADSRGKVAALLVLLWIVNLIVRFQLNLVWVVVWSLAATVLTDVLLIRVRSGVWHISLSSLVTGLLIGLTLDPNVGPLMPLVASVAAILSKQFVGLGKHKHVFNPAVFGIIVASLVFSRPVAWWAAAWGWIPVTIITLGMIPILKSLRRIALPLTFIAAYFFGNLILSGFDAAWQLTLDGTVILFAFIMLPEPATSLARGAWQYSWGLLVALIVFGQSRFGVTLTDPLLLALLVSNIVRFVIRELGGRPKGVLAA